MASFIFVYLDATVFNLFLKRNKMTTTTTNPEIKSLKIVNVRQIKGWWLTWLYVADKHFRCGLLNFILHYKIKLVDV